VTVRLIVIDVDGTLVGRDHQTIAPRVRSAIAAARARGVEVALCSGRPMASLAPIARDLGLPGPHIAFDGALVGNIDGSSTYRVSLANAAVTALVAAARARDLPLELYRAEGHYVDQMWDESIAHANLINVHPTVRDLDRLVDGSAEGEIIKALILAIGPVGRAHAREIESMGLPLRLGWAKPPPGFGDKDYINVTNPAVSKGAALAELAALVNVPMAEMLAAGDGPNDEPLIRAAGIGIAMGNAVDSLKALADAIVPDVDDDGLAVAIERYVLNA
jgi:Cof subfamily protein (haloacid dehalogenase superfamily)